MPSGRCAYFTAQQQSLYHHGDQRSRYRIPGVAYVLAMAKIHLVELLIVWILFATPQKHFTAAFYPWICRGHSSRAFLAMGALDFPPLILLLRSSPQLLGPSWVGPQRSDRQRRVLSRERACDRNGVRHYGVDRNEFDTLKRESFIQ